MTITILIKWEGHFGLHKDYNYLHSYMSRLVTMATSLAEFME